MARVSFSDPLETGLLTAARGGSRSISIRPTTQRMVKAWGAWGREGAGLRAKAAAPERAGAPFQVSALRAQLSAHGVPSGSLTPTGAAPREGWSSGSSHRAHTGQLVRRAFSRLPDQLQTFRRPREREPLPRRLDRSPSSSTRPPTTLPDAICIRVYRLMAGRHGAPLSWVSARSYHPE